MMERMTHGEPSCSAPSGWISFTLLLSDTNFANVLLIGKEFAPCSPTCLPPPNITHAIHANCIPAAAMRSFFTLRLLELNPSRVTRATPFRLCLSRLCKAPYSESLRGKPCEANFLNFSATTANFTHSFFSRFERCFPSSAVSASLPPAEAATPSLSLVSPKRRVSIVPQPHFF